MSTMDLMKAWTVDAGDWLAKATVKLDKHGQAILTSEEQEELLRLTVRRRIAEALQRKYSSAKRGGLYGKKTQEQIVDEVCDVILSSALSYDDSLLAGLRDLAGDSKEGGASKMRDRLRDIVAAEHARQEPVVKAQYESETSTPESADTSNTVGLPY